MINKILLIGTCLIFTMSSFGQKITKDLLDRFDFQDQLDCIIIMKDQLDLYGKTNGMKKDEKAVYVYQSLKSHALSSQRTIANYLDENAINFKSFFLFNGINSKLTKSQALFIADHFRIEKIVINASVKLQQERNPIDNSNLREDEITWGI